MSQSQNAETGESAAANPTRRKFIKGVTIGTGAAAIGGVSTQTRFSPVGTSKAIVPAVAAGFLVGAAAAGTASIAYDRFATDGTSELDENPTELQAYDQAISNEIAFEQRREQLQNDKAIARFEDALWSEVRAAGVRTYEDDGGATEAKENAKDRMVEVLNNRLVNISRAWNAEVGSAQSIFQLEIDGAISNFDWGQLTLADATFDDEYSETNPPQFSSEVKDGAGALVLSIDNPTLLRNGETIDFWFITRGGSTPYLLASPLGSLDVTFSDGTTGDNFSTTVPSMEVTDPQDTESKATLVTGDPYNQAFIDTLNTYESVVSDAESYLTNLESEYEKGTVDPSSVLTGRELMEEQGYVDENGQLSEEYDGATDEERLAAESVASGMGAPDDAGVRARITHASLSGEQTGNLFIDFTGDGGSLSVGEIPASDYNYAIMGVTYDDGSFGVETLESEADDGTAQPIEVLEVIGAQERDFSYTDEEITVGAGGDVVIYEGTDPPEELASPSEYAGYQVDIETADSTATVDISDITESGSQYIASTSLSEGTTVENIVFRAPVNYEEISGYEPGDTTVDLERLKEQEETIKNQQEQIEKLQNQGTGGGGGFLPDVSVDSNSTVIAAVAVVLVAFGLLNN